MQRMLDRKTKSKLLIVSSLLIGLSSLPFAFPHVFVGHGVYFAIHVASTSLGVFLSLVGFFTYREFKTTRLFLVMCAFLAITVGETFSFINNMIIQIIPSSFGSDALISHGLILLTLSFFVLGVFRSN